MRRLSDHERARLAAQAVELAGREKTEREIAVAQAWVDQAAREYEQDARRIAARAEQLKLFPK